jgi:hypothetical protein
MADRCRRRDPERWSAILFVGSGVGSMEIIQIKLERITRRSWFYLIILLLQVIPPYASKGFGPEEFGLVIGETLTNCYVFDVSPWYPLFKILPIVLVLLVILVGNRVSRVFSIYAAITYALVAVLQSVGVSETYGFGIILNNLIMFLMVAAFWVWEAVVNKNDFSPRKIPPWKYWVVPLAFLAFWYPANPSTRLPDFNPVLFFTNEAGLTFCMMTPLFLALLTLFHPKVNLATLRVNSLIGIIIGLYNLASNFVISPAELWWNGVLHIPLLSISLYAFVLSYRKGSVEESI